jgi:hypothetical protein
MSLELFIHVAIGPHRNAMFSQMKSYLLNGDGDLLSHRLLTTHWPFLNFKKSLKIHIGIVY